MAKKINKPVSVVIPTFNGKLLLEKNLPSVLSCLRTGDELLIVDDASSDDSLAWLKNKFKLTPTQVDYSSNTHEHSEFFQGSSSDKKEITVTVVVNKHNLRFGASSNRGVELSKHNLIFLLNNDVGPSKDVLDWLIPYFSDKNVFAVGCLEHEIPPNAKKTEEPTTLGGKNKLWFDKGMFIHSRADNFKTGETAWVAGGSGLFDKNKWLSLGGFDPAYYPAYWEDIDLSFRARKNGWKILFEGRAVVEHHHESTHDSVFGQQKIDALSWKNAKNFTWKNGGFWQKVAYLLWKPYWWRARFKER